MKFTLILLHILCFIYVYFYVYPKEFLGVNEIEVTHHHSVHWAINKIKMSSGET